jgi:hypothetical protein
MGRREVGERAWQGFRLPNAAGTAGILRPLGNVGCLKKLVNADFEKTAPGLFLTF